MRELIAKLSEDVGQLLVAGAHLAPSSPALAQDREALAGLARQLGGKVPAVAKLAEATARTTAAPAKDVASEMLTLLSMTAQVRVAQAKLAPIAAPLEPLPSTPAIGTPCNAKDLDDLYAALTQRGQGRLEVIERAIEGEYIADLRLVEALVYAMGDSWLGEAITDRAIPKLGRAIVAPIRARLEIKKGRVIDGRRLRALVAIEKSEARQLLEHAVSEGSAEIREAAMDAIADHVHGIPEFEKHALEAIRSEKSAGIRTAAMRALAGSASDEALVVLLEAIDKTNGSVWSAATDALFASKHPDAPQRILAKLREVLAATPDKPKRGSDDKEKEKAKRVELEHRERVRTLLRALAAHRGPGIADLALELVDDYGPEAAAAAVNSATPKQLERIAGLLDGKAVELFDAAVTAAFRLGADEAFRRLSPRLKAKDRGVQPGASRVVAIVQQLRANAGVADERWRQFLVGILDKELEETPQIVVQILGELREKRAVKSLIKMLERSKADASVAIAALGEIGDTAALDPIIAKLGTRSNAWVIRQAVLQLNDPRAVDKVRTIYARLKDPSKDWHVRYLLRALEARFPGQ
jgi:HEAT repeat protein